MSNDIVSIRQAIRDIPNFPKPGIIFKDITPLLARGHCSPKRLIFFADRYRGQKIDTVLGIESRGFIIGAALAYNWVRDLVSYASRESCPMRLTARATSWNMVRTSWKFTLTRLSAGRGSLSRMI